MQSESLGKLKQHPDVEEWWVSAEVSVPLWEGRKLRFVFQDLAEDRRPAEFEVAVQAFLRLAANDRKTIEPWILRHCKKCVESVGEQNFNGVIREASEVWKWVRFDEVQVIRRDRRDKKVYVQVLADCDWEPEHGLQIVFRDGHELSRVSDQDGHVTHTDAFDLPESEDRIS